MLKTITERIMATERTIARTFFDVFMSGHPPKYSFDSNTNKKSEPTQ